MSSIKTAEEYLAEHPTLSDNLRREGTRVVFCMGFDTAKEQGEEAYDGWLPTPDNINALPGPVKRFIHDLETNCDPAGIIRENIVGGDIITALTKECDALRAENERLTQEILDLRQRDGVLVVTCDSCRALTEGEDA